MLLIIIYAVFIAGFTALEFTEENAKQNRNGTPMSFLGKVWHIVFMYVISFFALPFLLGAHLSVKLDLGNPDKNKRYKL